MSTHNLNLPANCQAVVDRFVTACQADHRILAAFLGGSYARGTADKFSDLDLYLIIADKNFDSFCEQRDAFLQQLGEPVFLEDFAIPNFVFLIFADGLEVELGYGCESQFQHIHSGPYKVLLDKTHILSGVIFSNQEPEPVEQLEKLRCLIFWFWHDLSHFITAVGRDQLWWAHGQLEELRRSCVILARVQNNFLDSHAEDEAYFKLEQAMPVSELAMLQTSFCQMEREEMLEAGSVIVRFYKKLAIPLALSHGISYPETLEKVMVQRMESMRRGN